jgi:hypothetical protein
MSSNAPVLVGWFGAHSVLTACPWCARAADTGHDVFNDTVTAATVPRVRPPGNARALAIGATILLAIVVLLIIVGEPQGR